MISFVVKNIEKTVKEIQAYGELTRKSASGALKVEAYRLTGLLKLEIGAGKAGGEAFSPLTEIAKRMGKPINRKPLSRLKGAVRYAAGEINGNPAVEVGFIEGLNTRQGAGGVRASRVGKSWLKIAAAAQEGGETPFTEERRRAILSVGASLKKRRDPMAKYFFLRRGKTSFRTPPRPIIEPFWRAHEAETLRNVLQNFERKMRGERI